MTARTFVGHQRGLPLATSEDINLAIDNASTALHCSTASPHSPSRRSEPATERRLRALDDWVVIA